MPKCLRLKRKKEKTPHSPYPSGICPALRRHSLPELNLVIAHCRLLEVEYLVLVLK